MVLLGPAGSNTIVSTSSGIKTATHQWSTTTSSSDIFGKEQQLLEWEMGENAIEDSAWRCGEGKAAEKMLQGMWLKEGDIP